MNGLFITGTDTGVGKTLITAILLKYLIETGRASRPVKPVQSGCREKNGKRIAPDLEFILTFAGLNIPDAEKDTLCPNKFLLPASPHLAAAWEGAAIDWQSLTELPHHPALADHCLLVEGAGGLYVPVTRDHTMLDLIQAYELPVILAARAGLGTLNHSLLSVEALRARGCTVAAIVLNDVSEKTDPDLVRDNQQTLSHLASVPVFGPIPYLPGLDTEQPRPAGFETALQDWPGRSELLGLLDVYSRVL